MAWPTTAAATSDVITAAQLNLIPSRIMEHYTTTDGEELTLSGIPAHFRHLRAVIICRGMRDDATIDSVRCQLNGVTTADYHRQYLQVNTTTEAKGEALAQTFAIIGQTGTANAEDGSWSMIDAVFTDYTGTGWKAWVSHSHCRDTNDGRSGVWVGFLEDTDPLASITVYPEDGTGFAAGSRLTLFGLP